jgi:hypothetical protein
MIRIAFLLIVAGIANANSQHCDKNWVFCDSVGYNFNIMDTFHTKFHLPDCSFVEGWACISSESGELLFSCDGTAVYQGTSFDTVINGGGLYGHKSWTNGSVILPIGNKYVVINKHAKYISPGISEYGQAYINIVYDSLNHVWYIPEAEKNVLFAKHASTEQLAAIKHGNGRDWWIVSRSLTQVYVSLFDQNGYVSTDSFAHDFGCLWSIGEISVTKQGNKVAVVDYLGKLSIFDFERCRGTVSNINDYNIGFTGCNIIKDTYGCCFSPNGRYLYISNDDTLFQFDVTATDFIASKCIISINEDVTSKHGQMERTPYGKIFFVSTYSIPQLCNVIHTISVINKPDNGCLACDYTENTIDLHHFVVTGLPNMPDFYLGPLAGSPCDTLTSASEPVQQQSIVRVYPNPAKDVLNIELLNNIKLKSIVLTDISGNTLLNITPHRSLTQLNLNALSQGFYLLRLVQEDGRIEIRKVVIQR